MNCPVHSTTVTVYSVVIGDNSDLIEHVAPLYLPEGSVIRDLTWGKGVFWRKLDTSRYSLQGSDLGDHIGGHEAWDGHIVIKADFTDLPDKDASCDVVVLDPPYIHNPGKHSTDSRYNNVGTTGGMYHRDIRELYEKGMSEALRILKPGGKLLVKGKDEVESGRQCWSHRELAEDAESLGFYVRDMFILVPNARTSMNRWSTQKHARKVHSFLLVLDKPEKPTVAVTDVKDASSGGEIVSTVQTTESILEEFVRRLAHAAGEEFARGFGGYEPPKPSKSTPAKVKSKKSTSHAGTPEARDWLREQGYAVKPSGRIPGDLMEAYRAATKSDAPKRERKPKTERVVGDLHSMREWAAQQGMAVSSTGRLPKAVIEAYNAAHDG